MSLTQWRCIDIDHDCGCDSRLETLILGGGKLTVLFLISVFNFLFAFKLAWGHRMNLGLSTQYPTKTQEDEKSCVLSKKKIFFLFYHPELSLFRDEPPTVQYGEAPSCMNAMQSPLIVSHLNSTPSLSRAISDADSLVSDRYRPVAMDAYIDGETRTYLRHSLRCP